MGERGQRPFTSVEQNACIAKAGDRVRTVEEKTHTKLEYGKDERFMSIDDLLIELNGSYPMLDLHGLYPEDVEIEIDHFLTDHYRKAETVKIVYGVGSGALKEATLRYLEGHPMVQRVIKGQGFCLVFFYLNK